MFQYTNQAESGDTTDVHNRRPVSVLNVLSKVFERAIYNKLLNYLLKNKLITPAQHGFLPNKSTESAIIDFIDKIYKIINCKKVALGIFIDFSKAFDCVEHSILLQKLEHMGVKGNILKLLKSYLSNRVQIVNYANEFSDPMSLKYGVPQGSILGPLLFLTYINDINNVTNELHFSIFADDLNLLKTGFSVDELIRKTNTELKKISLWIKLNKLCLNGLKLVAMIFDNTMSQNLYPPIRISNFVIPTSPRVKFLGVILDRKLHWNLHISNLVSYISKLSGIIYQVRSQLTPTAFKALYFSLVYSKLIYCVTIWGVTYQKYIQKVKIAQNRVLRSYMGLQRRDSVSEVYTQLHLLKFEQIFKMFSGLLLLKFNSFQYCNDVFQKINQVHQRPTRASLYDIYVIVPRISEVEHSVIFKCPQYYNSLPRYVKQSTTLREFKRKLKNHILHN